MKESPLKNLVRLHISRKFEGLKIFPNAQGVGWLGRAMGVENGILRLQGPRRQRFGLHEGSPDDMGWLSIIVTPDMVGQRIAIAVGLEYKQPGAPRRPMQIKFVDMMQKDGCIAGFVECPDDADRLLLRV